jgi:hypothetical protein
MLHNDEVLTRQAAVSIICAYLDATEETNTRTRFDAKHVMPLITTLKSITDGLGVPVATEIDTLHYNLVGVEDRSGSEIEEVREVLLDVLDHLE